MSDLVYHGQVESIDTGMTFDSDEDLEYKVYHLTLIEHEGPDSLRVFVSDVADGAHITYEGRAELAVGDEAVWSLTEMAPEFDVDGGYVLTSSNGIFHVVDGQVRPEGDSPAAMEAEGLGATEVFQRLNE